jgi:hypothetical protein
MIAKWVLSSLLLLMAVGCGSQATVRQFDVSFEEADLRLRELYPSASGFATTQRAGEKPATERVQLRTVYAPHLGGPWVNIGRNELESGRITIRVRESDKMLKRQTEIVLKGLPNSRSEVSVQTSTSSKAVLIPPRDTVYEQKQMDAIAEKLKK